MEIQELPMEPGIKLRERAERYRQIARNTFDPKIADEIKKIAEDYEHWVGDESTAHGLGAGRW
jgi:hypothetical protein